MFQINRQWMTEKEARAYLRNEKRWEASSIDAVLAAMVKMGAAYYQPWEV